MLTQNGRSPEILDRKILDYDSAKLAPAAGNQNQCLLMNQLCKVCGEPAAGFHFGAFTCEGCKSFFGRTYNNVSGIAECKNGGRCEINKKNRTSCKSCRLRKCLRVGMSKSGSRYGRRSNWFKIHCLLQAQGQPNGVVQNSSETNNNNSTVTNNNTNTSSPSSYQNNFGKTQLPSTLSSSSLGSSSDRERDRDERERTPSSSSSRNGATNGLPPAFSALANLSPESLSTLNRKLNSGDFADYFRAAGMGGLAKGSFSLPKVSSFSEEERTEEFSRTTRSPGSLESPRSETSAEDVKSSTPHFTMPPGSPLEVKPNDLLPFDMLMKMGYDPLRLWPAMFGAQPNLHQFNPYRFIFPNFPGAASAFPGGIPPSPGAVPPLLNGPLHPAKLFSAAGLAAEALPSPLPNLPGAGALHMSSRSESPSTRASPPSTTSIRNRVTPIVPPSSSLTLTPPISHHGSEDPTVFPMGKLRAAPQEKPIDLSARSTNNNQVEDEFPKKIYGVVNGDVSDEDMDDRYSENDKEFSSDVDMKNEPKSDYEDSDHEEMVEDLSSSNNNNSIHKVCSMRRSSCASDDRVASPRRASTPLDLTRSSGASNSSPPLTKIST